MGRGIFTTLRDLSGPALARYIWPNAGRPGRKCINADGMQDRVAATALHRGIHFPPGLLALGKMVLWEREAGGGPPPPYTVSQTHLLSCPCWCIRLHDCGSGQGLSTGSSCPEKTGHSAMKHSAFLHYAAWVLFTTAIRLSVPAETYRIEP